MTATSKSKTAMAISDRYKEITRLRQLVELEFQKIEKMVENENHPTLKTSDVRTLRLAHSDSHRQDISNGQAAWHNVAYELGHFHAEEKARKMSKSNQ